MKKFWAKLISGLLAVACLLSISACAPVLNIDKAKKALEGNGYVVEVSDEYSYYGEAVEKVLYARHEDYDEYLYMLEFNDATMANKYYQEQKVSYDMEIKELKKIIEAREYYLKKYKDKIYSDEITEWEDEIKECKEELEYAKELVVGRSGKFVWYGTKDAVNATK